MPSATAYRRPYVAKRKAYTAKRNTGYKRPRKSYKRPTNTVANTVKRVLARSIESKWMDVGLPMGGLAGGNIQDAALLINGRGTISSLTNVPIGMTGNTRVGEYISPKSISIKLAFPNGIAPGMVVRVLVFRPKTNQFIPTPDAVAAWASGPTNQYGALTRGNIGQLLAYDGSKWDPLSRDEGGSASITVVKNMWITAKDLPVSTRNFSMYIKPVQKIHFSPGGNGADNGYYMWICGYSYSIPIGACFSTGSNAQIVKTTDPVPDTTTIYYRGTARFVYADS